MVNVAEKEKCSGCHACVNSCLQKCITMNSDSEGFWYPQIDEKRCIQCGRCENVCPIKKKKETKDLELPTIYAGTNKNKDVLNDSSSGGIFTLIGEYVINQGGVVFGAVFNELFEVEHISVEEMDGLSRIRGSKYVQSKIGSSYTKVKEYLEQNRLVLFSGTPCQIAGLKSYLKKDYQNLLCQDIICHGVPSPALWRKYITYRERIAGAKVKNVSFRDKTCGWKTFSIVFAFENGTKYIKPYREDPYMKAFLFNNSLRPSCYSCNFKGLQRVADFTLADFWHVNAYAPEMYDENGVSLVFIHSEKACRIFEKISKEMHWKLIENVDAGRKNMPMVASVKKGKKRNEFFKSIDVDNFEEIVNIFCVPSLKTRIKQKIKKRLLRTR